jgi:uncharacterized protein
MKWILVSASSENTGLRLVHSELLGMKIDCFFINAKREEFYENPAYYCALLKSVTHCVFFDNGMGINDPSLCFLFGFMSGHTIPIFMCTQTPVFNRQNLPSFLFCYENAEKMMGDIKSRIPQYKKDEVRRNAYKTLFTRCIPYTPDSFAAHVAEDDIKSSELFRAAGMDLNSCDKEGTPLLCIAARNDRKSMVAWLLDHGANINVVSSDRGYSPTMDAVWRSNADITRLLVERGANLNYISRDGQSVLVLAVGNGNEEICELLVSHGADPDVSDTMGMSARAYAKLFKKPAIVAAFEKYTGKK